MKTIKLLFFVVIILLSSFQGDFVNGETKPLGFATVFPELIFRHSLSKKEQAYLGLKKEGSYGLIEIKGSLLLIEFLNIYCVNCVRQAPILNDVYHFIEGNSNLKGKVKIIGIAAGNNIEEVKFFKDKFKIPYPIFPDTNFNAHQAVGSPRTPYMIWVRKEKEGRWIVMSTHLGLIDSPAKVIAETKAVLQYDLALISPKKGIIYEGDALTPPISEEELIEKARLGMEASGGKVIEMKKIMLKDKDFIYMGRVLFGAHQKNLFSKLASRRAVCDICHDTFFIYTFDSDGKIVDLIPIYLTKVDNLKWTDEDIKKLKNSLIGRSIFKPFAFDPKVDSISGATITTILIFDSLEKAKEIYEKIKKEGYINN